MKVDVYKSDNGIMYDTGYHSMMDAYERDNGIMYVTGYDGSV